MTSDLGWDFFLFKIGLNDMQIYSYSDYFNNNIFVIQYFSWKADFCIFFSITIKINNLLGFVSNKYVLLCREYFINRLGQL